MTLFLDDIEFVSGMVTMGYLVCAAFFLRFWRRTRDELFAIFAASFVLFAFTQAAVSILELQVEEQPPLYLLRLTAFGIIIIGILRKNFAR